MAQTDTRFAGSIPDLYDRYMVPLMFAPHAAEIVGRLAHLTSGHVLETAAGTGAVTAALAATLPPAVAITATDLNQAMLDRAMARPNLARIDWRQANALALPFPDGEFDAVVCQFGAMFFPDRRAGFGEALRVLKPDGMFLFNVWDSLDHNEAARIVHHTVAARYPNDPPGFFARTPHGYHDPGEITADLRAAGFSRVAIDVVQKPGHAAAVDDIAIAMCQGTPLRNEIEARAPDGLPAATRDAAAALAARFGAGPVATTTQALLVTARR